MQIQKLAFDEE
jgi:hypothetical protein